jgi:hypothetical protein
MLYSALGVGLNQLLPSQHWATIVEDASLSLQWHLLTLVVLSVMRQVSMLLTSISFGLVLIVFFSGSKDAVSVKRLTGVSPPIGSAIYLHLICHAGVGLFCSSV